MKIRYIFLALMAFTANSDAKDCPVTPAALQKGIEQLAKTQQASEYCAARRVIADKSRLSVVVFTLEGSCIGLSSTAIGTCSNQWTRYMIASNGKQVSEPIKIGGKGSLNDTSIKIVGDIIQVNGLSQGPHDAMCCPSIPAHQNYILSGSRLSLYP